MKKYKKFTKKSKNMYKKINKKLQKIRKKGDKFFHKKLHLRGRKNDRNFPYQTPTDL